MDCLTDRDIKAARKDHRCDWCGETIAAGSAYHYQTGIYCGSRQATKYHPECYDALGRECDDWGVDEIDLVSAEVSRGKTSREAEETNRDLELKNGIPTDKLSM